ncbi:uncharacterized protein LOC142988965 isoform X2 [Genypterus blacodes]|uniref:uncharacterized protein LOC142988965 isoform X2 n=1 Tax=Genypterus blacodes TaxID=154954 RepID=UPI003F77215F
MITYVQPKAEVPVESCSRADREASTLPHSDTHSHSAAMQEGNVTYASVQFKNSLKPPAASASASASASAAKKQEEAVYDEVKVQRPTTSNKTDTGGNLDHNRHASHGALYANAAQTTTADVSDISSHTRFVCATEGKAAGQSRCYQILAWCAGSLCVLLLLLAVIVLVVHMITLHGDTNVQSDLTELRNNQTALMRLNHNLTGSINNLNSANENLTNQMDSLRSDGLNQKVQIDDLTRGYAVLEKNNTDLTRGYAVLEKNNTDLTRGYAVLEKNNTDLTRGYAVLEKNNTDLSADNQMLKATNSNFTKQIEKLREEKRELTFTVAQETIDDYCPKTNRGRQCVVCPGGWMHNSSSCYGVIDAFDRSWEEARQDCREKNSELAVIESAAELAYMVGEFKWFVPSKTRGSWIGLEVSDGSWKWVDGTPVDARVTIHHHRKL